MKSILYNEEEYTIDCDDEMCGNCEKISETDYLNCKLFNLRLDHWVGGPSGSSAWKRCRDCMNAEIH